MSDARHDLAGENGPTLLANVLRRGRPSLSFALRVSHQLCAALGDVHRRGLVLGSLDPRTIVVSDDGTSLQVASLDSAWSEGESRRAAPATTTAYTSPEQTGRINREIDRRSDFYSLGAVLYEMVTGQQVFASSEPLELIHAHVARTPAAPDTVAPDVPEGLSALVMKLLAKAPEDRYQGSAGLQHDLEICERVWAATARIPAFVLGEQDIPDRFRIPQRLYGRERELQALLDAFEQTCGGGTTLMLVSGYAGSGKTSLIGELGKPIVRERAYFTAGKFDQVVRNIPYGALVQAFRDLIRQFLAESDERLTVLRDRLSTALGANGGVLTELIPEAELMIGRQSARRSLDPVEAQNRFRYVFQAFVGAIARPEHPLVLFLDDLQWADAATLNLLHALVTGSDITHLLVICAYRDNEVSAAHPVTGAIRQLQAADADVRQVALAPLPLPDLVALLRDTLRGTPADVEPLARLIQKKTEGNPFFTTQLLQTLQQEGLFTFDRSERRWSFRMDAIARAGTTDNVIDLMTRKIRRLSAGAQEAVTLAACIGNRFEWETFVTVSGQAPHDAAAGLAELLDAGLIHPAGAAESGSAPAAYVFLHDRVQQAAYDVIPADRRAPLHLEVGRLLLAQSGNGVPDERIFEIVNHLNIGRELAVEPAERLALARLNLAAGRKAKLSTAYETAAAYLDVGLSLLSESSWQQEYELTFDLHLEAAECHYLAGHFDRAHRCFDLLAAGNVSDLDRAKVYSLRIVLSENLSRWSDALDHGREGLALFGISFPERPDEMQSLLDDEVQAVDAMCGDRTIASLVDLPEMRDPWMRMAMRILTSLWAPAYISGNQLLTRLISVTMVRLSLTHGNTEDSAYGYVTHAITVGPVRLDYRAAYEWGSLALAVNERLDDIRLRAKIHQQFQAHVNPWRRPHATCIPHAREARRSGLEAGDFTYAAYGAVTESWPAFFISRDIRRFVDEFSPTLALLERMRMSDFRVVLQVMLQWALALDGRTADRLSLSDDTFDEEALISAYARDAPFFLTFFYSARLHLALVFGEADRGIEAWRLARAVAQAGTVWPVLIDAWGALAMASGWPRATEQQRAGYRRHMDETRAALDVLADNCPENFRCLLLLVSGEMARTESQVARAATLFDEAIDYAHATGNVQGEAMASEICGRLWIERGRTAIAAALLSEARRSYEALGASAKVRHLEETYGDLVVQRRPAAPVAAADTPNVSVSLDISTVLKVAQAIAAEIEVGGLLRRLMRIVLENAGAQRGVFLQERDGQLFVEAEASADGEAMTGRRVAVDQVETLAHSVVRYVRRTGQSVVLGEATLDERFAGDPYVSRSRPRSVLCVPVEHQGRRSGVLYLENNLAAHTFTPDRIEMMRVLAAQTAISLENARLYEETKNEVARRADAELALRGALSQLEVLKNRLEAENVYLQEEIRTQHNFNEIVGNSPALLDALRKVERVAPTDAAVLIVGETGSGKELFARAVHSRSRRNQRPLVKVNCGAIAPGLVESELFGHVKGAFTGAIDKRIGRFELADGGTIFLDEVGELPLDAQVKLLRVLQEQEFEPVGSSRTVRVSVRVIAATNRNLEYAVAEGKFRADLLYRLNVFPIDVPPLRARPGDIPLLAGFFVSRVARSLGKPLEGFSTRSMERILGYSWPGNVRELQNLVERSAILAEGPVLNLEGTFLGGGTAREAPQSQQEPARAPEEPTLDAVQRSHILGVLDATGGVIEGPRGAANILGVHPNTLRSRMKKLGITPSRDRAASRAPGARGEA